MNALKVHNFTKRYDTTDVVHAINFEIPEGAFFGFLGPNGAGKTTTIKCITGISQPTSGTIEVFGVDVVKDYRKARAMVGLSPQEFNVDIFAKPRQIVGWSAGYFGMRKSEIGDRVDELFALLDLKQHEEKKFMQLSGGLKRRVILARAMVHDPKLLILDEPTAGVDVELRREIWQYLKKINEQGKSILFTSHYLEEVEALCKRVAIINEGHIVSIENMDVHTRDGGKLEDKYLAITQKKKV